MTRHDLHAFATRHHLALSLCGTIVVCAFVLAACGENTPSGPSNSDQPSSMVLVVTSTPGTGDVKEGQTRQYAIQVRNSVGTTLPSLTLATWSIVGNAATASVTQTGLATCLRMGTAVTVRAVGPVGSTYATLSADASLTCVP